jgi:glycosyltransferase involved in cell wall biosynthesis
VRDEADNLAALLDSILAQTRPPDEIVINDCGSRDNSAAIVRRYAARDPRIKLVEGGHNIASGRNNAIAHAAGPLIASTDAGLVLDPHWLEQIIAPLEAGHADQVGGFFQPVPRSLFELALGATNYRDPDEIDPAAFLPFGKSMAFRREIWARVGGFPEWADHCEDIVFNLAIEREGYQRAFVPTALLSFRPRSSLRAFARQYYFYARGDGIAGLWPRRHAIRYATYSGLVGLLLLAWRVPLVRLPLLALLLVGGFIYTRAPYRRLWSRSRSLPWQQRLAALALVPLIRLVGDCAKMAGYPVGRARRHTTAQR